MSKKSWNRFGDRTRAFSTFRPTQSDAKNQKDDQKVGPSFAQTHLAMFRKSACRVHGSVQFRFSAKTEVGVSGKVQKLQDRTTVPSTAPIFAV